MIFINNQTFLKFLREVFPDISHKLSFAILLDQENSQKKAVLFFNEALEEAENDKLIEMLNKFSELSEIVIQQAGVIPLTDVVILRKIKELQPVSYETLLNAIKAEKITFEELDLKRELDKLRKSKMLIRSSREVYLVTEDALSKIPHGKGRNSSDIKRLLELGRRKW